MFYHINAFKQTEKKKYQLDFTIEGDFDVIKNRLAKKGIITLGINKTTKAEAEKSATIDATIYNSDNQKTYIFIVEHENVAKACLLLAFLWFDVRSITDRKAPLSEAQSNQLIAIVQQKLNQHTTTDKQEKWLQEQKRNKQFEDEKLIKLREIAEITQKDIKDIKQKARWHIEPNRLKVLEEIENDLQKYSRGTNTSKISITLKQAFNLMEAIEINMIDKTKQEEILLIKDSMISNVDILNEYNKREKATKIQEVWEKSTNPDDKYYAILGKLGIYTKFLKKEFLHKMAKGSFITTNTVTILNHISIIVPSLYAGIILWNQSMNNPITHNLFVLSNIAIYASIRSIRAYITRKKTLLTLVGIPLVIAIAYGCKVIIYNTFAL